MSMSMSMSLVKHFKDFRGNKKLVASKAYSIHVPTSPPQGETFFFEL